MIPALLLLFATVRGVIVDSSGAAIANAKVQIGDQETRSKVEGTFELNDISKGGADLTITAAGFKTRTLEIRVGEPETILPAIALDLAPIANCEQPVGPPELTVSKSEGETALRGRLNGPQSTVTLEGAGTAVRTSSNAEGDFRFTQLKPGTYRLRAHAAGHIDFVIDAVRIEANTTTAISPPLPMPRCPQGIDCRPTKTVEIPVICL